jgi:hypothetical protein
LFQPINLSTHQPLNLSTYQPINLSTYQPINHQKLQEKLTLFPVIEKSLSIIHIQYFSYIRNLSIFAADQANG